MNLLHILLRRRASLRYHVAADGSVTIRQGRHRVCLSHSDYQLLSQISKDGSNEHPLSLLWRGEQP